MLPHMRNHPSPLWACADTYHLSGGYANIWLVGSSADTKWSLKEQAEVTSSKRSAAVLRRALDQGSSSYSSEINLLRIVTEAGNPGSVGR